MITLTASFAILLAIGLPITFAIGLASVLGLLSMDAMLAAVPQRMFAGIDSFILLAAPFYILTGELMGRSGLTERLIGLSLLITRKIRGGTAYAAVVTSVLFSGISGTAVGDAAAMGQIFIKDMRKEGYTNEYASGLIVACSMLGPIIPPSVMMVVYSAVSRVSILDLFIAGIVPGLAIAASLAVTIYLKGRAGGLPVSRIEIHDRSLLRLLIEGALVLTLPVVIIRGAVTGMFTTTEAGGVAALYAIFLGLVVFRTLDLPGLWESLIVTARITASIYMILAASEIMSYAFTLWGFGEWLRGLGTLFEGHPVLFMLAVAIVLLLIGTFLEPGPAVILFVPMLLPAVDILKLDELQFAMVVILTLTLGLVTPPVGICMFVVCRIANLSMWQLFRGAWPFFVAELVIVVLLCLVPELSSWLPRMLKN